MCFLCVQFCCPYGDFPLPVLTRGVGAFCVETVLIHWRIVVSKANREARRGGRESILTCGWANSSRPNR